MIELAQLLFVVGHVGMKMVIHFEKVEEQVRAKYRKDAAVVREQKGKEDKVEDELDQVGGGKEAETEKDLRDLKAICERMLDRTNLLGLYVPILENLAKQTINHYSGSSSQSNVGDIYILENVGINALCKLMYTSEKFCAGHLEELFTLLKANIDPVIKHNIVISLGDIANRFPNQMEHWKQDLFDKLRDKSAKVRRTTLMVLAHLILNDMLKVRGELAEICLMQDDADEYIRSFVELFLYELSSKGAHIIYNALPKALAYISQRYPDLQFQRFEKVVKSLIKYIDKDKQAEQLIEKLCLKLKGGDEKAMPDWINVSYVLSLLNFTDKGLRKLLDMYDAWKDKVPACPQVKTHFLAILSKVKRPRTEEQGKNMVEELEIKLGIREGEIAKPVTSSAKKANNKKGGARKRKVRKPGKQELAVIREEGEKENEDENKSDVAGSQKEAEGSQPRKIYRATKKKKGANAEKMSDIEEKSGEDKDEESR